RLQGVLLSARVDHVPALLRALGGSLACWRTDTPFVLRHADSRSTPASSSPPAPPRSALRGRGAAGCSPRGPPARPATPQESTSSSSSSPSSWPRIVRIA